MASNQKSSLTIDHSKWHHILKSFEAKKFQKVQEFRWKEKSNTRIKGNLIKLCRSAETLK